MAQMRRIEGSTEESDFHRTTVFEQRACFDTQRFYIYSLDFKSGIVLQCPSRLRRTHPEDAILDYFIGFFLLLGGLIVVHEFGHFIVAKAVGIKVLKFSLGFPPKILTRKWGETEYILGATPLGGYVKLLGEDSESDEEIPEEEQHRAFTNKPLRSRVAVIVAGPLANYLLAVVLLCVGYVFGWPVLAADIGKVMTDSPAAVAGLKTGDKIIAIDGKPVRRWDDMRVIIEKNPGKHLTMTVQRLKKQVNISITPRLSKQKGIFGQPLGRIGVMPSGAKIELSFPQALYEGCRFSVHLTGLILKTLVKVIKGEMSAKALSGPITIVQASGESLKAGWFNFLFLLSFISINLAIINLLPVPILDGGHLLFFFIEAITRRPVTGKLREVATHVGLIFIIFLMVLVFYNDISRIITTGWSLKP
jgi:regulator of sigma E protease